MAATPLALSSALGEPGTVSYWAPISMGWSGESGLSVAMMFKPDRLGRLHWNIECCAFDPKTYVCELIRYPVGCGCMRLLVLT